MIDTTIFRAYDIRGNASINLTTHLAYNVGYHFAKLNITQSNDKIVVGYDGRLSSPALFNALTAGVVAGGGRITTIGLVPTPLLYFADKKLQPAGSIMVTGSHNPKEDNGFKMLAGGKSFFGEQIIKLKENIVENTKEYRTGEQGVIDSFIDLKPSYLDRILENIAINPTLKIVWDSGNGAAGEIVELVTSRLSNVNITINSEIDGSFPNHHPDPTVPKNLEQLIAIVRDTGADLGIAFDGDADRIGVVTSKGQIIWGDQLMCIYSKDLLARAPGSTIIADVKASQILFDYITKLGGKAIMWKTGHSLIKTKMLETNAAIAGEMSGHIFFADGYYGYDDAVYAALRLIDIISRSAESLEQMVGALPETFNTPEIRLDVKEDKKFQIVEELKTALRNKGIYFNDVDGVRVTTNDGWWLVRASNTQAALIARCEAGSQPGLELVKNELNLLLKDYNLAVE